MTKPRIPLMNDLMADKAMQQHLGRQLLEESDRICALVGGAMVEEAIKQLLTACMLSGRPPTSFDHATKLAHDFGLINDEELADIEDMREIRNSAAHVLGALGVEWSFASQCQARCDSLRAVTAEHGFKARIRFVFSVISRAVDIQQRALLARTNRDANLDQAAVLAGAIRHAADEESRFSVLPDDIPADYYVGGRPPSRRNPFEGMAEAPMPSDD